VESIRKTSKTSPYSCKAFLSISCVASVGRRPTKSFTPPFARSTAGRRSRRPSERERERPFSRALPRRLPDRLRLRLLPPLPALLRPARRRRFRLTRRIPRRRPGFEPSLPSLLSPSSSFAEPAFEAASLSPSEPSLAGEPPFSSLAPFRLFFFLLPLLRALLALRDRDRLPAAPLLAASLPLFPDDDR